MSPGFIVVLCNVIGTKLQCHWSLTPKLCAWI